MIVKKSKPNSRYNSIGGLLLRQGPIVGQLKEKDGTSLVNLRNNKSFSGS